MAVPKKNPSKSSSKRQFCTSLQSSAIRHKLVASKTPSSQEDPNTSRCSEVWCRKSQIEQSKCVLHSFNLWPTSKQSVHRLFCFTIKNLHPTMKDSVIDSKRSPNERSDLQLQIHSNNYPNCSIVPEVINVKKTVLQINLKYIIIIV